MKHGGERTFDEREKIREIRLELDKTREVFEAELVKLLERAAALVTAIGFQAERGVRT